MRVCLNSTPRWHWLRSTISRKAWNTATLTITVDGDVFGCSRDTVVAALKADGIDTRPYYSPPVHRQTAYAELGPFGLPVTDRLASQVISLPIWSHMPLETIDRICEAVERMHEHGAALEKAVHQV